ncbi:hypothetical protein Bca4012_061364 [Brassica carinata]
MSSIPNRFNSYHDEIYYNNHGFAPQFRNHNSKMIRSMFTTDHMNHGDLFSLSSSFSCYQNSSSSSFGLSNSQRTYQMKRNTSSVSHAHSFPLKDNPHFPQNGQYDGRTHSLPYEKYGPYTCSKCNGVFDTSQKFDAHMSSQYKSETKKDRDERYRARNKSKYHKLNDGIHGRSKKIKLKDKVNSSGKDGAFQHHVMVRMYKNSFA